MKYHPRFTLPSYCLLLPILLFSMVSQAKIPGAEALGGLISDQFDINDDGEVDTGEWQTGIAAGFKSLDADGNGNLTTREIDKLNDPIREQFGELGAIVVVTLVKAIVLTFDSDKNQSVSKEEYDKGTKGLLTKIDADRNGSVSNSELLELPEKVLGND